ncbi:MAG: hypothetical protein K2N06_09235 [Oscillospiraceae bacterium]|nr:hypothetical protein [Oscillospiraceae bacterium]
MKRIKPLNIVFLALNALILVAAIVIMIYFAINPIHAGPLNPEFYEVAMLFCLPPLIVINLIWLIIWKIRHRKDDDSDDIPYWEDNA